MPSNRYPTIGVMGSHDQAWEGYAQPLGELIAKRNYNLLTGAGAGIMIEVAKSFTNIKKRKGSCIGIMPIHEYHGQELGCDEFPNTYIEIPIITQLSSKVLGDAMPFSRNQVNIMSCDALVFLPGSHGTRNEVSIALMHDKPMILFGPESAFDKFPEMPLRANTIEQIEQFLNDVFYSE